MAHHLARLVYRMLRYGENYVEKGISITSRNSDSNALNGFKKRQTHLICNWLPLSSFHHQFLESIRKYLRFGDLCKELAFGTPESLRPNQDFIQLVRAQHVLPPVPGELNPFLCQKEATGARRSAGPPSLQTAPAPAPAGGARTVFSPPPPTGFAPLALPDAAARLVLSPPLDALPTSTACRTRRSDQPSRSPRGLRPCSPASH